MRSAEWQAAIVFAIAVLPSAASGNGGECYQRLDPARPHVDVPIEQPPRLKFHRDRERTGPPVLELDAGGLYRDGTRICGWHGGAFGAGDRGLEPVTKAAGQKKQFCPGLPIVSTCGDLGLGGAHIYVEFVRHDAVVLEARCAGKPCYLAMASLPSGWREEPSAQDEERARRAEITAARAKDPALGEFLDGTKACLVAKDVPACLAAFVSQEASLSTEGPPPLPDPGPKRARAVIELFWSTEKKWIQDCIHYAPSGDLSRERGELSVWIPESFLGCTARKEKVGWRFYEFIASD